MTGVRLKFTFMQLEEGRRFLGDLAVFSGFKFLHRLLWGWCRNWLFGIAFAAGLVNRGSGVLFNQLEILPE